MRPRLRTAAAMKQIYVDADDLLLDSFRLARQIHESGFRPNYLIGLWRGGSAVGIAVQEGLEYFGIDTDHIAVRTSYRGPAAYAAMLKSSEAIRVHGLEYLIDNVSNEDSMLIVDDVYSTGSSVRAVIDKLSRKTRRNLPQDIRIATVWFRPSERTVRTPDFSVRTTQDWLVLPYELSGLSIDELKAQKPELAEIMPRIAAQLAQD